jgi:hypothetical protein
VTAAIVSFVSLIYWRFIKNVSEPLDVRFLPSLEFPIVILICSSKEEDCKQFAMLRAICHLIVYEFEVVAPFLSFGAFKQEIALVRDARRLPNELSQLATA